MNIGKEWLWMDTLAKGKKKSKAKQQLPDAKKHQIISFIKSGIRIIGYALLPFHLVMSVIFLILSEVVGIIEELV